LFLLLGCGRPAEKPASAVSEGRVIATVNGEPILDKDLKLALANDPSMQVKPSTKNDILPLQVDLRALQEPAETLGAI